MMNEQHHEMVLEKTHSSGEEEWHCPTCGRRILLRVPPNNEMVIVEPGDHYASHWGSNGSLRIGTVQVAQRDEELDEISEESLRPWIKALENLDLNW
jgi:DNA-directed RNA polymerase subunit RPC12/RpoP